MTEAPSNRSGLLVHLGAAGLFYAAALLVLGPIDPGAEVWGSDNSDVVNHLAVRSWQADRVAEGELIPTHSTHLLYPEGGRIWIADLVGGTLITPAVWIIGLVPAYNLLILANLVFSCWAMFWLVRRLTGDPWAALLCGAIYGLCPTSLGHVNNGVTEMLQTGWLPLFLGALLALGEDAVNPAKPGRTFKLVVAAAALWWLSAVGSQWYYGMFASLIMLGACLAASFHSRRLALWARAAAVCGLFALAVFPVAYYFWGFIRGDGVLTRAAAAEAGHFPENTADLAFLFSQRPPEVPFGETFFHLTYLGFALPILSVVGLLRAKTRKATAVWLAAALVCLVLAAGLTPVWNLQPIALFKDLSPYRLLGAVIPFFAMMEFPYRFFIPLYLFLALAAGTGLAGLPLGRHAKAALACALSVLVICEYILSSGAPSPAPRLKVKPGELIARLRQGSRKEALFDLPFRLELPLVKRYVLGHLHHGRPIVYCSFLNAPVPFSPWLNQQSLINSLLFRASNSGRRAARPSFRNDSTPNNPELLRSADRLLTCLVRQVPCPDGLLKRLEQDKKRLAQAGLTHYLLHGDLLREGSPLPALCEALFGLPAAEAGEESLYILKSGP